MDDSPLLILTAIGLCLNVLSMRYLKRPKTRKIIKYMTVMSMFIALILMMLLVIAQTALPEALIVFYTAMFLWNLGFFEVLFIVIIRPKKKKKNDHNPMM